MLTVNHTKTQDFNPTGTENVNLMQNINKTYSTMLKFIPGTLVGGAKYSDIYVTSDDEDDDISRTSENNTILQKITAITTIKRYQHCRI
jgi:hypothetical protein